MKKEDGYNLIELMIALAIGLIIIAATIAIYVSTIKANSDIIKSARLSHDLDSAMALMVNDIRRAGYWGGAMVGSDGQDNPSDLYTHLSPSPLKKYPLAAAGDTPVDTRSATPPVPRDGR